MAPNDYQQTVNTGGELEKKYMNNGEWSVLSYEEKALQGFEKFLIYFPDKMINDNCTYPVIILSNGTGASMSIGCNKMNKQKKQFGEKMLK